MNMDPNNSAGPATTNPYNHYAQSVLPRDPYKQFKQERKVRRLLRSLTVLQARKEAEKQAKKEQKYLKQYEKCESKQVLVT